jgi:hypothetical protein
MGRGLLAENKGVVLGLLLASFSQASSYQRDSTGVLKEERLQRSQAAELREFTYT